MESVTRALESGENDKLHTCSRCKVERESTAFRIKAPILLVHHLCQPCREVKIESVRRRTGWVYHCCTAQHSAALRKKFPVCCACRKPPGSRNLCIDHKHSTREIRGLLCNDCNSSLGNLREDFTLLYSARNYLETAERSFYLESTSKGFRNCRGCKSSRPELSFLIPADPVLLSGYCKDCRTRERHYVRDSGRRSERKFLSRAELRRWWLHQEKFCRLCREKSDLCLDHDPQSEIIRGVLCRRCNLGVRNHNSRRLNQLISYLLKSEFPGWPRG